MAGHARLITPAIADGSAVMVPVQGQGSPVLVIDARPRLEWSEAEIQQAVETQQKKAGALVALVRSETEATWAEIRRELNEVAGGRASARVMVMAHHALRAHQALELQTMLAEVAAGKTMDELKADAHGQRNQSGLSVIATQALNQAYEAARSEAGNRSSPTEQLMNRIGVGRGTPVSAEGPALPARGVPGGVNVLVPSLEVQELPPIPPVPGACT